jgi:hypothetical protein
MDEYARLTTFCSSSPLMPLCTGFDCIETMATAILSISPLRQIERNGT